MPAPHRCGDFVTLGKRELPTRRKRVVYVDKNGQVAARYVRLITFGRFEIALTWIPNGATL